MKMTKTLTGITIATAAALAFTLAPVIGAQAASSTGTVKCVGANSCKGKGACKTSHNKCKGLNSCKGKSFVMTSSKRSCKKLLRKLKRM